MLRQNEELNHATTYCRFLEEELFSARKKEKDKGKVKLLSRDIDRTRSSRFSITGTLNISCVGNSYVGCYCTHAFTILY